MTWGGGEFIYQLTELTRALVVDVLFGRVLQNLPPVGQVNKGGKMKRIVQLLLSALLALVISCTEKDSTSPEPGDDYTFEGSETIGPGGGTFEIEDFSLSVPAGAFDADYELELYASSEDQPFDESQVTRTFRLEGLPAEYSQPLRVSIKYEGDLIDESFVGQGEWAFDAVSGDTAVVYRLHAATDSSGHLVCEWPASAGGATARDRGPHGAPMMAHDLWESMGVLGINAYLTRTTWSGRFAIRYPAILLEARVDDLAGLLEDGYDTVVDDIHLSYEERWWSWPVEVVLKDLGSLGPVLVSAGEGPPVMNVDEATVSQGDLTTVRVDVGRELLFLALTTYDEDCVDPAHFWLHTAVLEWSEEEFTDDPIYQSPERFPGNEMAPFEGMRAGAGNWDDVSQMFDHGRGMSAMIKYLVDDDSRYGEYGLRDTYEAIWAGSGAMAALLNTVNALVADWWPDFFRAYVGGGVYNVDAAIFTQYGNLSGYWNVDDEDDTLKVFSSGHEGVGPYPDLSAKLFLIDLNYTAMDAASSMVLTVSGEVGNEPVTMVVFGVKDGPLEYWGHTTVQSEFFEIPGLRGYIDDGWRQLLVVVVNSDFDPSLPSPYTGTSDIDLEIRITEETEPEGLDYNTGQLTLSSIHGYYHRDYFDPGEQDYDYEADVSFETLTFHGSMTGDTFTATWDYDVYDYNYQGSVQATFVGNPPTLISGIQWTETISTDQLTRSYSVTMNGLVTTNVWEDGCAAEVWGGDVGDHVGSVEHTRTYSTFEDVLQNWECNDDYPQSHIHVGFWKE